MTFGDPFEDDEPCDGMDCALRETCARWVGRCAITWQVNGETHVIGIPMHNTKPKADKCRFWLAIPNDKYPDKDDVCAS